MYHSERVEMLLGRARELAANPERKTLIEDAVNRREALPLTSGTLATWTAPESTGRSPRDTYIVKRSGSEDKIDWSSPSCIPMSPDTFEMIFADALAELEARSRLYSVDRVVGADPSYALPVRLVTYQALAAVFIDNMFRPVPEDIHSSIFARTPFTLLCLPHSKLNRADYEGHLRKLPDGRTSDMAVVMDFDNYTGIVYGSSYMGSMKKLIFTVMNYWLPEHGILPLHCSANEGEGGDCALLLGLSGTGKTTISSDSERALLGDDEHGWNGDGIANFEYGCYAKLINLNPEKEPEIYKATFHTDNASSNGSLVENMMVYPDGTFDLDDARYTQNSRASYPLRYLDNVKDSSVSGHPQTILFLTADAYGVLPPISRLSTEQAMFQFMMGYTSKLAGTETGITEPQATFSRFFAEPFMPRYPGDYTGLLGKKMQEHAVQVFLVNTGWSGGPYGVGRRIDISLTRAMVRAALAGDLDSLEYRPDPVFKLSVPVSCPGVPEKVLNPVDTWQDKDLFLKQARKLAARFRDHFQKTFDGKVAAEIAAQCPG